VCRPLKQFRFPGKGALAPRASRSLVREEEVFRWGEPSPASRIGRVALSRDYGAEQSRDHGAEWYLGPVR